MCSISYRDFRDWRGPNYNPTVIYWNVLAARLAFILIFQHLIFAIVYVIGWFIPDVPNEIQDKIKRERFLDQQARWSSKSTEKRLKSAAQASKTTNDTSMTQTDYPTVYSKTNEVSLQRRTSRK